MIDSSAFISNNVAGIESESDEESRIEEKTLVPYIYTAKLETESEDITFRLFNALLSKDY